MFFSQNFAIRQIRGCWFQIWQYLPLNSSPKIPKYCSFSPKLRQNLDILSQNFAIKQIRGCWFQIWKYFFQIAFQKYRNKRFLVQNLGIFVSSPNFAIRQIRGCLFQIWQYLLSNSSPKIPKHCSFSPKFRQNLDILSQKFAIRQIRGCWFQIWQYYFQLPAQRNPNEALNLGPKFKDF